MRPFAFGNRLQALVLLVALVPLVIVAALTMFWLAPQARRQIVDNHREMAAAVSSQVADHLRGAERELSSLAQFVSSQIPLTESGADQKLEKILDAHVGRGEFFEAVYLVDAREMVASVGLPAGKISQRPDLLGLDLSNRQFVRQARRTGASTWSHAFLSIISAKLAVAFATPMGKRMLVGEIAIEHLTNFVSRLSSRGSLYTAILDGRGQVVAYSHPVMAGQVLAMQPGRDSVLALAGVNLERFQMAGREYVGSVVEVRRLGWRVLVAEPLSEAQRPLLDILRVLGIGLLSALSLSLLAGWIMSRRVAGGFARLAGQARAIAGGDYEATLPDSGTREFNDLGEVLKSMAEAIRQRERELAYSQDRLVRAQAVGRVGSWELDVPNDRIWGSDEAFRIYGLAITPDHGIDFATIKAMALEEDRAPLDKAIHDLVHHDAVYDVQFRMHRANDGSLRHIHTKAEMERSPDGSPKKVVGTIQDITERRDLEDQLLQSQKLEAIGMLAGGVAHDFNNMLSVILGFTELMLSETPEGTKARERLGRIQGAANRSRDLTRQLLAFSRKQIIDPSPQDMNQLVEETIKNLGRLIGEDITLSFIPDQHLWAVRLDPSQVHQILMNLAVNARDAMPDGGKLLIELSNVTLDESYCRQHSESSPGDFVVLAVSDTGSGMDKKTAARIFEPFFTTKQLGKGTGLGLSTVYGIVKQNDGFVNVYSEPGRGTTFKLFLPRHRGEGVAARVGDLATPPPTGTGNILLVEDEDLVRQVTAAMLEELGYRVASFKEPKEAVEACAQDKREFDLLLTDVVMPEMSGKDLASLIEALQPGIGVLFMSGYTSNVIVHHGVLEEGVNFLPKPFNTGDLACKVAEAMPERAWGRRRPV